MQVPLRIPTKAVLATPRAIDFRSLCSAPRELGLVIFGHSAPPSIPADRFFSRPYSYITQVSSSHRNSSACSFLSLVRIRRSTLLAMTWFITWLCTGTLWAQSLPMIRIVLREEVEISAGRITIGDIADIYADSASLRQQIARLELEDSTEPGTEMVVTQRRVILRLQLAHIDITNVRLEGSQLVRVKSKGVRPAAITPVGTYPSIHGDRSAQQSQTIIVKKGEFIRLIARAGPLEISTRGEALAEGKLGQVIPVRNIDSKQVVQARIIRPAMAQVDY